MQSLQNIFVRKHITELLYLNVTDSFATNPEMSEIALPGGIDNANFNGDKTEDIAGIENKNFTFSPDNENPIRVDNDETQEDASLEKRKTWNVIILGNAFMLIFAGYLTSAATSETIIRSYELRTGKHTNGFIVQGIGYLVTALTVPFTPALLRLIGRKATMIIGGFIYVGFILTYINPVPELIYTFAVLMGVGGSLVWIAQVELNNTMCF